MDLKLYAPALKTALEAYATDVLSFGAFEHMKFAGDKRPYSVLVTVPALVDNAQIGTMYVLGF